MQHLIDAFQSIGIQVKREGSHCRARCPFHNEKSASFTIFADGHYHCFGCGAHGLVSELTNKKLPKQQRVKQEEQQWPVMLWSPFRKAMTISHCDRLARWRGYSDGFVKHCRDKGFVGVFKDQFCFPIVYGRILRRVHVRADERRTSKNPWFYEPAIGCPSTALSMKLGESGDTHFFESQWDALAAMEQIKHGLFIATRGACNASKLAGVKTIGKLYAWPQNDEAGERWLSGVMAYLPQLSAIWVPENDVNDFTKKDGMLLPLLNEPNH